MNNIKHLLLSLALTALCACGSGSRDIDNPGPEAVVMKLRNADRLYVAEYVIHKLVTADDVNRYVGSIAGRKVELDLSIGERKIAIPMDAHLKAYVDFSSLRAEDIVITENPRSLTVTLPAPRVVLTSSKIDHDAIREFRGFFRSRFSDEEMSRILFHTLYLAQPCGDSN